MYSQDVIDMARQEADNTGEELPSYVTDAPILRLGVALYYNAWFELDSERNRVRLRPITRSSVFEYCRDYDLSDVQTDDMWFYVSRMDNGFLNWYETQIRTPSNGNAT
jgi:hypothetical protein